jgi:hypothetical protein
MLSMRNKPILTVRLLSIVLVSICGVFPAFAEQFRSFDEIREEVAFFENRPSFDVTPVTVKFGTVTYRIPRNYLTALPPAIPTLRVTFPGFKPLTQATHDCLTKPTQASECVAVEFALRGGSGPGSFGLTHAQQFQNYLKNLKPAKPRRVLEYDVYDLGPENARTETYRNEKLDLYFYCFTDVTIHRPESSTCNDSFQLEDRNHAQFFFHRSQVGSVAEIEVGIRQLMANFVVSEPQ